MPVVVQGLCSMATRGLLATLSDDLRHGHALAVTFEATGGVRMTRRIRAGAAADLVVLSSEQMSTLESDGLLEADTLTPLFVSDVVAAVPRAAPTMVLATEDDLRGALTAAQRVAYSTGPSGKAFLDLLRRWELDEVMRDRLVEAAPGRPVGSLLARGEADLGFQQRSELADLAGVSVLGPLPGTAATSSTFSGAVLTGSRDPGHAREVLAFLASEEAEGRVVAAGMARA